MTDAPRPSVRPGVGTIARPALACAVLIACVFGVYEFIERTWLTDVGPELRDLLHVLRGVSSTALVGVFVAWHLRRPPPALDIAHPPLPDEHTAEAELASRGNATWFVAMRWLAAVGALLATLLATRSTGILPEESLTRLLACAGVLILMNIGFEHALPRVTNVQRFLFVQAICDLVIITMMLHYSGGIENPLYPVYLFHVVLAAALLPPRAAYAVAAVASVLLVGLGVAEGFGFVDRYPMALGYHRAPVRVGTIMLAPIGVIARVASTLLVCWVTAFFTVALSTRTRQREGQFLRSSAALRDLNRELELVADSIGDALSLWTGPDTVSWCNRPARGRDHCSREVRGACPGLCRGDSLVRAAFATGEVMEEERAQIRPDGRSQQLAARAVPLRGSAGNVAQVLLVIRDLTAQRAMEMEVLHGTKMAVLGRVAAAMAHEIGNPLAAMTTRLALIEHDPSPDFVRESAKIIQQQLERIHRLVQSVRRFGRPSSVARSACNIADTVQEVVRVLHMDPRAGNVTIETRVDPDLPPVNAIRDQLTQVFVNLAINALESMPGGGRLAIDVDRVPIGVRVRFTDVGGGLTPQARANLFRPFFTTKTDGSGLGLFLCRRLVCELGGTIEAVDAEGGTTFEVQLRADPGPTTSPPAGEEGTWARQY